jgi:hypothetical protein
MTTVAELTLPENRVLRKRVAARTTGIHVSALPAELRGLADLMEVDGYFEKRHLPEEIQIADSRGKVATLSRDEAWMLADKAGADLEGSLLSGRAGKVAAFFSTHGQGIYANYGRPTMDFSAFFRDYIERKAAAAAGTANALSQVQFGPLFIALDTASASGFTALGHFARGASLAEGTVLTDVVSTGAYEGTSAWATAKLGVFAGAKAMGTTAVLPVPGAPLAAIFAGFVVGAATAVVAKRVANQLKDVAIDSVHSGAGGSESRSGFPFPEIEPAADP